MSRDSTQNEHTHLPQQPNVVNSHFPNKNFRNDRNEYGRYVQFN